MQNLPELGDVVQIRRNKQIWADETGYYIITKIEDMYPTEVKALTKSKTHFIGETIAHKKLNQFINPMKIKASNFINKESFRWIKETDDLEATTIVHFIGNNRELEFIIAEGKLVSNVEFEFHNQKTGLTRGRMAIELPTQKTSAFLFKTISKSIENLAISLHLI
jgi:hypothetical protein